MCLVAEAQGSVDHTNSVTFFIKWCWPQISGVDLKLWPMRMVTICMCNKNMIGKMVDKRSELPKWSSGQHFVTRLGIEDWPQPSNPNPHSGSSREHQGQHLIWGSVDAMVALPTSHVQLSTLVRRLVPYCNRLRFPPMTGRYWDRSHAPLPAERSPASSKGSQWYDSTS